MKKIFRLLNGIIPSLIIISSGCSIDPDARLNRAIDLYLEKEPGALQDLELAFIKYSAVDSVEGEDLQSSGTLLYNLDGSRADIVYPRRLTLELTGEGPITQVAANASHAAITDGVLLGIFDGSGSHRRDETIGDRKSPIRALAIDGDNLFVYKKSIIYRYDLKENVNEQAYKENFPSPYTSYYNAHMERKGKFLGVLAGIAGSYSFNVVDAFTGAVLLKNLAMSSSRYYLGEKAVYYIAGNSGKWELMRFDLSSRTKKSLALFTDLVDIELVASGYINETSKGIWTALYGKDRKRIPFRYELSGSYKGRALLRYRGNYYFIDMLRLNEGLRRIIERAPGLKTDGKK